MCRIAGIINFTGQPPLEAALAGMRDSMAHGGPDDAGIFFDGGVALAHRRLSIIDLSPAAHQPMKAAGRNVWITYNGEIYNFQEIKRELIPLGHKFTSSSDTEVVLAAYLQWGEEAFSKFSGMFAFCLFDKDRGLVFLVRDHAGIKPLYYSVSKDRLVFASEVKAFKKLDSGWPAENSWPVYFLAFGHIPEPFTTLKNVFSLPAGSYMRLDAHGTKFSVIKHYDFKFTRKVSDINEAKARLKELLLASVNRHLISDVPTGVFLSGGLDSSLIALAAANRTKRLRTLSIIFDEAKFSEQKYQRLVVNRTNSEHSEFRVTKNDFYSAMPEFFSCMDQPSIDGVNTWFISKYAKSAGLTVVLSGLGADELFGGYASFYRIGKLWPLRHVKRSRAGLRLLDSFPGKRVKRLSYMGLKSDLAFYLTLRGVFSPDEISKALSVPVANVCSTLEKLPFTQAASIDSPENFACAIETEFYMRNQLLKDTDCMSMANSIEVRVPFLDKDLMSFMLSVDPALKFGDSSKQLLKDVFFDLLPPEIIYRTKMGFTFPFQEWVVENPGLFPVGDMKGNWAFQESWSKAWALHLLHRAGVN